MKVQDIPVFICVRDRVSDLTNMVSWLFEAGQKDITLIDNASTYPPCLEYLKTTKAKVVYLNENLGHHSLFLADLNPEPPFFYSDPDLVFLGPQDGLQRLHYLAMKYPERNKVGFGLSLEGVPESMPQWSWEKSLQSKSRLIEPRVYDSPIDTTFAIYNRPSTVPRNDLRTGAPYVMRHSSWHTNGKPLSDEDQYYLNYCEDPCSTWLTSKR